MEEKKLNGKVRYEMFLTREGAECSRYLADYSILIPLPHPMTEQAAAEYAVADAFSHWGSDFKGCVDRFVCLYDETKRRIGVYGVRHCFGEK